jgi:threonine dehydrogenase-like Zn-dependent dehydrogenase
VRGLVVERPGTAHVTALDRPSPGPGEVLVRVHSVGICGSDVEILEGTRPAAFVRYPIVPGHEWSGTVETVGAGVARIAPGDAVVAQGIRGCGACARCLEGLSNLCSADYAETGFTHQGACADFVCVPAALVHTLPAGADLQAAALLEPAACVATGLLAVGARAGADVAVVGSGTLGLLAVALLRLSSPRRLTLVGSRERRLELGLALGATDVVDVRAGDPLEAVGGEYDLVFEATNGADGPPLALQLARRGGTVLLEGISGAEAPSLTADLIPLRHLRVQGVFGGSPAAWRWVVELFSSGQLDPRPLVTHRFPLEEFERAFDTLSDRDSGALKVELAP